MNDQNDTFDINTLRELFRSEAYDLLTELENALLALEETPGDKGVIGRVFRALHTIKGSGGACGFDVASRLAHEVETLYDAIRNDKLDASREIISLTLSVRDQIAALFDEFYQQKAADHALTEELVVRVRSLVPKVFRAGTKTPAPKPAPAEPVPGPQATYRIRFRPARTIFRTGTDPQGLLDELGDLGTCRVVAQLDEVPPLEDLDPELCYLSWDIILTTDRGVNSIRDIFIFQDPSALSIEEIGLETGPADDGEDKKLGEILVERGELSPTDVQGISYEQKRIGEILVERGLVNSDRVEAALTEQQHLRDLRRERQRSEETLSVRVSSGKLDKLVDLVGELVTVQARLTQIAAGGASAVLLSIAEEVERLTAELRDHTMNVRMLPIGTIFSKFKRVVRDLSQSLGKDVELITEGGETELDKSVIEKLHDPLVHIIRNCIDHGIETPGERQAAGKPQRGTVGLSASYSGAHVLIRVQDDGAGIDLGTIKRKAVEKGLISATAAPTEKDLYALILLPGFSTASGVTELSGRGVGMDVVKQAIDALRGSLEIDSRRGAGTTITLQLPLTLAIIDGFLAKIGDDHFVFPLSLVDECVELSASAAGAGGRNLLNVRGEIVPYIRLRDRFGIAGNRPAIEQVVIVKAENARVGFVVDHIVGGHQTVIKSLGRMYKGVEGLSGATILGDGGVALILDVPKLVQSAEREEAKA